MGNTGRRKINCYSQGRGKCKAIHPPGLKGKAGVEKVEGE